MIKVNLGSGPSGIEGWTNYDWGLLPVLGKFKINKLLVYLGILENSYSVNWPNLNLRDIRKTLPYKNYQVDFVYCSHVLEHFEREDTVKILMEVKRVLKKNGVVRIVLPDLEIVTEKYLNEEAFNDIYAGFEKKKYKGFLGKIKLWFIRPHLWMYTRRTFMKLLKEAGFKNIRQCSFGKGKCPDLEKLDLPVHQGLSFYVEAGN
jgi:SAM-dependent methyltransferase